MIAHMDCAQKISMFSSSSFAGVKMDVPAGTQAFLTKLGSVARELTVPSLLCLVALLMTCCTLPRARAGLPQRCREAHGRPARAPLRRLLAGVLDVRNFSCCLFLLLIGVG